MQNHKVHGGLTLVGLIYGANYSIAKEVMPHYVQPYGFTLLRIAAATVLFWGYHAIKGPETINYKKDLPKLLLCALLGVTINQLSFLKGLSLTSPINAALIMTITPVLVLLASALLIGERISLKKGIGVGLGLIGAILLVLHDVDANASGSLLGDFLIFINACSYGIYLVLIKPLMQQYRPATVIKWVFLLGFFMVLPFGWEDLAATHWASLPFPIWLAIVYVVVFTTFVAYLLNVWTLKFVNPSVVGMYIYLQPLFATALASVLGQDQLGLGKIFYSILIFSGVYLVSRK